MGGAAAGIITCVWKARFPGEIILAMIPGIGLLIVSILTGGLLGEGDGLFLIVSGFFLEWQECVLLLITGQVFCGIFGLAMMVGAQIGTGGGSVRKQRLPFLPFLLLLPPPLITPVLPFFLHWRQPSQPPFQLSLSAYYAR